MDTLTGIRDGFVTPPPKSQSESSFRIGLNVIRGSLSGKPGAVRYCSFHSQKKAVPEDIQRQSQKVHLVLNFHYIIQ